MNEQKMFQVSTLQALALGYSRPVVTVEELLCGGGTGLGTFEDVNGEMIAVDGRCYRAAANGTVVEARPDEGVPFGAVTHLVGRRRFELTGIADLEALKTALDLKVEEDFGLNSMHMVRIDGTFTGVSARSVSPLHAHHVSLFDLMKTSQQVFSLGTLRGTLLCVYFPDYMDGINAPGWHFHIISEDRTHGGHVLELGVERGEVRLDKIARIDIRLPRDPAFDTYSLKNASQDEIKKVEQGERE